MPDHVTTRCVIMGPRIEIERFRTTMIHVPPGEHEETLDFNMIIPMPETLKDTSAGSNADLGVEILTGDPRPNFSGLSRHSYLDFPWVQELGITTIDELRSWAEKERPEAIREGQKVIVARRETGFYDWYDWRIVNWGTKWNSYGFRIENNAVEDGLLAFLFDTAWSFPSPIFKKLATMFPALRFDCTCFDQGWGFAGRGAFNGEPAFEIVEATDEIYEAINGIESEMEAEADTLLTTTSPVPPTTARRAG